MEPRKPVLLRIDSKLWSELERWASEDLRSLNSQVEWLLRDAVKARRKSKSRPREPDKDQSH